MRRIWIAAVFALLAVRIGGHAPAAGNPILILVSLDGWRADYFERLPSPNLHALAARGVRAKGLVPSFPVLTFPNHYTMVTGLYPEHHGIVANAIIDPSFPERFTMSAATARDSRWWGGEPLWVTAELQGRWTAPLYWPGTEARIHGVRPAYWRPFEQSIPSAARVDQILAWAALPEERRPSFMTLYFDEVDSAGHNEGPDSWELARAASNLDDALGALVEGICRLGLEPRTNIVVVSDHGMTALSDARTIFMEDYLDPDVVAATEWDGLVTLYPAGAVAPTEIARRLQPMPHTHVYTRDSMPARWHYDDNARIAPVVVVPDIGWRVTTRARLEARRLTGRMPQRGAHGYDPQDADMRALFVAAGPLVREHFVVEPFENVHVYDFLCALLGVRPAPNDGDPQVTRGFLRR